jgi:outer membrane protein W
MRQLLIIISSFFVISITYGQGDWNTIVTYNMAIPLGNTADYINEPSFRGVMVAGDYFLEDEWSVGFALGLQTFYKEMGRTTVTEGTTTLTGDQFRYLNSIPMLVTGKYHFDRFAPFTPHVGLGAGLYNMIQTVEFAGFEIRDSNWQIGISPEVGFGIALSPGADFYFSANYNSYFESKDIDAQSYLAFQVGFRFIP